MIEREHTHTRRTRDVEPAPNDLAPGHASRSAELTAPSHPIESGLAAAPGADTAVASAMEGSTGTSLPAPVMSKFESSLGVDLSGVRVHTGAASEAAAHAVSARAFAVGQDIHFGAGEYDPESASGQHLLAHEVAHTVQQRGSDPTRQNKLDVSAPGDAFEVEADRAADAMVSGAPTSVSRGGVPGISRKINFQDRNSHLSPVTPPEPSRYNPWLPRPAPAVAQPDANDPYLNPISWDPGPTSGPELPAIWAPAVPRMAAAPKPWIYPDGTSEGTLRTEERDKAAGALDVFEADFIQITTTWENMSPHVRTFNRASRQLGPQNPLEGWNASRNPNANQHQLTNDQKVGDTTVGGLFRNISGPEGSISVGRTVEGVDASKVNPTDRTALKTAWQACQTADRGLSDAGVNWKNSLLDVESAKQGNLTAINGLQLSAEKLAQDKDGQLAARIQQEKDDRMKDVEYFSGILKGMIGAASKFMEGKTSEGLASAADIGSVMAKRIVDGIFDDQIRSIKARIDGSTLRCDDLLAQNAKAAYAIAQNTLSQKFAVVENFKRAIATALATRQKAYDDFAQLASKSAGGGRDGTRLAAAIEAIPKVMQCLDAIRAVRSAIVLPTYSPASGSGFTAVAVLAGDLQLPQHVGWLQGYREEFKSKESFWQDRLTSLKAVANSAAGLDAPAP